MRVVKQVLTVSLAYLYFYTCSVTAELIQLSAISPPPKYCTWSASAPAGEAFIYAKKALTFQHCRNSFGQIFNQLLEITSEDPGKQNLTYFADFIVWNKKRGVISSRQASKLFNSYFSDVFTGLPSQGNVCRYVLNNRDIYVILNKELEQKKKGISEILGRPDQFNNINKHYHQIILVLDATRTACRS